MKAIILILLLATAVFAVAPNTSRMTYGLKYSTNTQLGTGTIVTGKQGSLMSIPKTYNNRLPLVSSASKFNPNRNVIHSNVTTQTWDYLGYCIEQPKSVQLRATKLTCTYQKQDRQLNSWSCATDGYLRCAGTSCPKNTCRVQGVQVS